MRHNQLQINEIGNQTNLRRRLLAAGPDSPNECQRPPQLGRKTVEAEWQETSVTLRPDAGAAADLAALA